MGQDIAKERLYQLEMFSGEDSGADAAPKTSGVFLAFLRSYEKTVLFIILVLIVAVAAFSLGVEKGKRSAINSAVCSRIMPVSRQDPAPLAAKPAVVPAPPASQRIIAPVTAPVVSKPPENTVTAALPRENVESRQKAGYYTVQVACYRTESQAKKAADQLRRQALSPIVIYKKPYYVLCAGSFSDKNSAALWVIKLKKQYKDCFVRRF